MKSTYLIAAVAASLLAISPGGLAGLQASDPPPAPGRPAAASVPDALAALSAALPEVATGASTPTKTTSAALASALTSTSGSPEAVSAGSAPVAAPSSSVALSGQPVGSLPWNIIAGLTLLTVIPALLLSMTPFVRLLVIFHFLRQALGTQTIPTNQTLIGLSLFLTYFLMQPVGAVVYNSAALPYEQGIMDATTALDRGTVPIREYMLKFTREKDLALFLEVAKEPRPARPEDLSMRVVIPAYIISELKAGFQVGAVLFLPFLVIDMVVASITTSVGMMQLPPVIISTPLKLLLFVMVDGWHLLIGSILKSFS